MTLDVSHPTLDLASTVSDSLKGKKIVLAVTGSIAAVETIKLARELIRRGAVVQGVMSEAAQTIIHPWALQYATGRAVITEITGDVEHVAYCGERKEAYDLLLIAPCTANTIGKIASGIDDTPVTTFATTAIGSKIPVLIVPAMHGSMYDHLLVQQNIRKLEDIGLKFLMPKREEHIAKIPDNAEVVLNVERMLSRSPLRGKKVLITSGPNFEEIDPIRVLTSRSTGRMGIELALEAYRQGAEVTVVHKDRVGIQGISDVFAESAGDMMEAVLAELRKGYDLYISAAAISDFTVEKALDKISSAGSLTITLQPTPKIIDRVRHDYPGLFIVAFKADTVDEKELVDRAERRLEESGANMIVANRFGGVRDSSVNDVFIIRYDVPTARVTGKKSVIAGAILDAASEYFK
ncbi:bifunctional phosphopantothenoylcysteine decarboxylase/phosphopantothenate--cysteine ligase CoaBC [Methanocella sp. MCL-LM]|uniref:bifunctional phosphopantothenoylcysteine decarboxylase/phosphopantothenate--cysteine ligase CoaBC n=1 Tax=Methanocella sp. MCL-LM TaxID=3412035 RepID=UPI003C772071